MSAAADAKNLVVKVAQGLFKPSGLTPPPTRPRHPGYKKHPFDRPCKCLTRPHPRTEVLGEQMANSLEQKGDLGRLKDKGTKQDSEGCFGP